MEKKKVISYDNKAHGQEGEKESHSHNVHERYLEWTIDKGN